MKRTHLIAVLAVVVATAVLATDASAYYHPTLGRFLSRDPGPGASGAVRIGAGGPAVGGAFAPRDEYVDGMNLYQYVRGNPTRYVDRNGAQAVVPRPAQVPVTAALYGDYPAEGGFAGWAARVAGDRNYEVAVGTDAIKQLEEASKKPPNCCIKRLFIFHHAYEYREHSASYRSNGNQYPNSAPLSTAGSASDGLMIRKPDKPQEGAADLADLQAAIANKAVRFCNPCSIVVTGCRMAETKFPAALATTTGCAVTAAHGASAPEVVKGQETGRWSSAPKYYEERRNEPYTGWQEYSPDGTSKQVGQYIRVWGE